MTCRPILFSAPMVRAILSGTKSQTRRIVKPQPDMRKALANLADCGHVSGLEMAGAVPGVDDRGLLGMTCCTDRGYKPFGYTIPNIRCPYGQPGDRLWVREEHHLSGFAQEIDGRAVADADEVEEPTIGCHYHADGAYRAVRLTKREGRLLAARKADRGRKMQGRFQYKSCARIWLEITGVRVERVQEISEADAKAEGVERNVHGDGSWSPDDGWLDYLDLSKGGDGFPANTARGSYLTLWLSINGPGSWAANPWVWVVEFKRVTP